MELLSVTSVTAFLGDQPADLILVNAQVVTNNPQCPVAEEVALRKDRIVGVGTGLSQDMELSRGARILDCGGGAVLPGFIDAHLHLFAQIDTILSLDLSPGNGTCSIRALVERLREGVASLSPGAWLKGKGYNDFYLEEGRHPTRADLDAATPDHPVKLTHRSHHAHVLNSLALKLVGINRFTPDPPGGLIERDLKTGEPTGLLFEMGELLAGRIPKGSSARIDCGVIQASRALISAGVTTFQDASQTNDFERWEQVRNWKRSGLLVPRISMLLGWAGFEELLRKGRSAFPHYPGMKLGGLKIVLDRTSGDMHPTQKDLMMMVQKADSAGWGVAVHSVEQETLEAALAAFEALGNKRSTRGPRHRIEHCSLCPPDLVQRLAAVQVSVVTQPSFLYYHGDRYLASVPSENVPMLYPVGDLVKAGIRVAASSDCPVVPLHPLSGIGSAVTRRSVSGAEIGAQQKVDVATAVRMHTSDAAWMLGMEKRVGAVVPGMYADLVLLNCNPLTTQPEALTGIHTVMTIAGGKVLLPGAGET